MSTPRSSATPSGPYAITSITGFGAFGSTISVPGAVPGAGRGIRRLRRDFVLRADFCAGADAGDADAAEDRAGVLGAEDGAGASEGRAPPGSDSGLVIASSSPNVE